MWSSLIRRSAMLIVAVLVLLSGCTPAAQPSSAPQKAPASEAKQAPRNLTIVFGAEPRSINPPFDNVQTSLVVFQSMFDSFLDLDSNSKLAPRLAESWESMPPKNWRLKLRRGVSFQNGEPFNAEA